jgi:hypothetical protein
VAYEAGGLSEFRCVQLVLFGFVPSILEYKKRDTTLKPITKKPQALHVPVGLLLYSAFEQGNLWPTDEKAIGELMQSVRAWLAASTDIATQMGEQHG